MPLPFLHEKPFQKQRRGRPRKNASIMAMLPPTVHTPISDVPLPFEAKNLVQRKTKAKKSTNESYHCQEKELTTLIRLIKEEREALNNICRQLILHESSVARG